MNKVLGFVVITMLFITGCANDPATSNDEKVIITTLRAQQDCWNNGDIDCFMSHYWNNDSLMFVGGERISYGWQSVTDNYKKTYNSKELMGQLKFNIVKIEPLSPVTFLTVGSWNLERPSGNIGGMFSLLWKKIDGNWVIVLDHTS